jgi:hypothetical protein
LPADEAAGEGEEAFVDVVASVCADEEAAAVVKPREGALDDPALASKAGAVAALAAGDHRFDPALPDEAAVLVVVVAAVGEQRFGPSPRPADSSADGRHAVEQLDQLGDVVAVAAGQRPGKRDAAAVYEEMMFAPSPAAINGTGTRFRAPFFACK